MDNQDKMMRTPLRLLKFTPRKPKEAECNAVEASPESTVSDMTSPTVTKEVKLRSDGTAKTGSNVSPHMFVELGSDVANECDGEQVPQMETACSISPSSTMSTSSPSFSETNGPNVVVCESPNETDSRGVDNANEIGKGTIGDNYISKENLNLVMLDEQSLEEYEMYVQDAILEQRNESELRKTLIQEELDTLIRLTEEKDELNGHEFEPEAVEALGIAANHVCYLQKYYDVARCEYVFVPSVANTIMNGSLLEEASRHYFGKSDEFLISYAASLGSTIIATNDVRRMYLNFAEQESELMEHVDLGEDIMPEGRNPTKEKNTHISDLFLGVVSPRSAKEVERNWATPTKKTKPASRRRGALGISVKLLLSFVLLIMSTSSCWLVYQSGAVPWIMEASEDTLTTANRFASPLVGASPPESSRIPQTYKSQELVVRHTVPPLESSSNGNTKSPLPEAQSEITSQGDYRRERLRRPIVANLLY